MKKNTFTTEAPMTTEEKLKPLKTLGGLQEFAHLDLNKAINALIYGTKVKIVKNNEKKPKTYIFSICEQNSSELEWLNIMKDKAKTIDLNMITGVSSFSMAFKRTSRHDTAQMLQIHYGKNKEFVLLFKDSTIKDHFWYGLQYFIEKHLEGEDQGTDINSWLVNNLFKKNDHKGYRTLNKKELQDMVKSLSLKTQPSFMDLINEHKVSKDGEIDEKGYVKFFKHLLRKEEISPIFEKYASSKASAEQKESIMTQLDLIKFFKEEQKQVISLQDLKTLSENIPEAQPDEPSISFHVFSGIIFSPANSIFNTDYLHQYQDLTRPMTDYYINSSHNTYLMSNQLTGVSSVQAYINALKRGCRCVELDLWDGPNKDPIIYHGHTMTSKIFFEDVIKGLRDHAFVTNPYPLILSFEMHCGLKAQKKIADILKRELGDMIYSIPQDLDKYKHYPSPTALKHKFILKCKGNLMLSENIDSDEYGNHKEAFIQNIEKLFRPVGPLAHDETVFNVTRAKEFTDIPARDPKMLTSIIACKGDNDKTLEHEDLEEKPSTRTSTKPGSPLKVTIEENFSRQKEYSSAISLKHVGIKEEKVKAIKASTLGHIAGGEIDIKDKKKKKKKVHPELNLLYGLIGKKYEALSSLASIWEIFSLNEDKFEMVFKAQYRELVDYHKKCLTRIYPSNLRVNSSNYCPVKGWTTGAQLVALNFQSDDEPMLLNYAKFRANGGSKCGYVLKPSFMLHDAKETTPLVHPNDIRVPVKRITIQVISAQALRSEDANLKSVINPFVEVKVRGVEFDEKNNQIYRTHTVHNNGFHPVFAMNGRLCKFSFKIAAPQFCSIVFAVYNEDLLGKYRIGWYAIDFNNMRQGYRVIPLLNNELRNIKHTYILCHIGITDIV